MRKRVLLRLILVDLAAIVFFAATALGFRAILPARELSDPVLWAIAAAVFLMGTVGYGRQSLNWWRKRLSRP